MDSRVRFYVRRRTDGRWTFGHQDEAFLVFKSKEAAVAGARVLAARLEHTEFVVEAPAPGLSGRAGGVRRGRTIQMFPRSRSLT